jgi:CspA family cold shock protein
MEFTMPLGRVKWFSLEKGFGFISSEEGEDVYLAASALPEGVTTIKPGTKLEFGVADSRRGPQALSVRIIDAPASIVENNRINPDDLATMIEDTIKILDKVGNGLRHGRHPHGPDAERLAKVLHGIASAIEG